MSRKKVVPMTRKPRQPSEEAIRRIEEAAEARGNGVADSGNQDSLSHDSPSHDSGRKGVRWKRARDGAELRATTVHLPVDLARRLRIHCAEHDRKQSAVIAEALAHHLGGRA